MEKGTDFLDWLVPDMSALIFRHLDPADIIRASVVSHSWNKYVIGNGIFKDICLRICPEVSLLVCSSQNNEGTHNLYAYLSRKLISEKDIIYRVTWIGSCIVASSTAGEHEHIENTLSNYENETVGPFISFWSSKGELYDKPDEFESLTYQLSSELCIVDEIKIRPWRRWIKIGNPIFSAKFVRFKMGSFRFTIEEKCRCRDQSYLINDDNYTWTYISPEYPMLHENVLQSFKLPRPVLCVGGVIQIELRGRVQRCNSDNLYYICISNVQVFGRAISRLALLLRYFRNCK